MMKSEMIREELRLMLSMDANEVYLAYKDAVNKKEMVQILTDQNPRFNREQMLDLLEDLGFRVGNMRKKPMDEEAKAKWHREHPNNGGKPKSQAPKKLEEHPFVKAIDSGKSLFIPSDSVDVEEKKKPFLITQEILDVANALKSKLIEVDELLDEIEVLRSRAEELGVEIR